MNRTDGNPGNGDDRKAIGRRFLRRGSRLKPVWLVGLVALAAAWVTLPILRRFESRPTVILYASQDQVYAEPILKAFERGTGIRVRSVFDSEAAKTVALANRLLAERRHPQCDVLWGNEEFRTRQLAAAGVFREANGWTTFGYRSRRLVLAANASNLPPVRSLLDLTNAAFRGRVALAYPMFGTTATHFLALRQHWGKSNWLDWCRAFAANKPFLVDGNSAAARFVARGEVVVALTDSDDIAAEVREGARILALPMTAETLLLPNTVAVIRGCPHPQAAQRLFDYLCQPEVIAQLVAVRALEGSSMADVTTLTLQPDWNALLLDLEPATAAMKRIFRR